LNERFAKITDGMPLRLQELLDRPLVTVDDIGVTEVPQSGVYVFFEGEKAIYVGRSNRLKKRLREHSQRSSDHYSATLAFRIAKQKFLNNNMVKRRTNKQLMEDSSFVQEFEAAKDRIAITKMRFIEIDDQIEQAMFEMYVHLTLNTELNDFSTH